MDREGRANVRPSECKGANLMISRSYVRFEKIADLSLGLRPRRVVLEQNMIVAIQRNELGVRQPRRKFAPLIERLHPVAA